MYFDHKSQSHVYIYIQNAMSPLSKIRPSLVESETKL
jgi:hypothetical protein